MRNNKHALFFRSISTILVCTLFAADLLFAIPSNVALKNFAQSFKISSKWADVLDSYQAPGVLGEKTLVVYIQDAHGNLSAQKNLSKTLKELWDHHGVNVVLVEGGTVDVSLLEFKPLVSNARWRQQVHRMFLQGKMAGEEYLQLTTDLPLKILGVDDAQLYSKSLLAYQEVSTKRNEVKEYVRRIQSALDTLKHRVYPQEILKAEKNWRLSSDGNLSDPFWPWFLDQAQTAKNSFAHPAFKRLQDFLTLYQSDDETARLNKQALLHEKNRFLEAWYSASLESELAKEVRACDQYLDLTLNALDLQMTPETHEIWSQQKSLRSLDAMAGWVNAQLAAHGMQGPWIAWSSHAESTLNSVERFYQITSQRDHSFVENAQKYLEQYKQRVVVLVAGGYHAAHLKSLLKDKNFSYIELRPKIDRLNNIRQYESVLLESVSTQRAPALAQSPVRYEPLAFFGARLAQESAPQAPDFTTEPATRAQGFSWKTLFQSWVFRSAISVLILDWTSKAVMVLALDAEDSNTVSSSPLPQAPRLEEGLETPGGSESSISPLQNKWIILLSSLFAKSSLYLVHHSHSKPELIRNSFILATVALGVLYLLGKGWLQDRFSKQSVYQWYARSLNYLRSQFVFLKNPASLEKNGADVWLTGYVEVLGGIAKVFRVLSGILIGAVLAQSLESLLFASNVDWWQMPGSARNVTNLSDVASLASIQFLFGQYFMPGLIAFTFVLPSLLLVVIQMPFWVKDKWLSVLAKFGRDHSKDAPNPNRVILSSPEKRTQIPDLPLDQARNFPGQIDGEGNRKAVKQPAEETFPAPSEKSWKDLNQVFRGSRSTLVDGARYPWDLEGKGGYTLLGFEGSAEVGRLVFYKSEDGFAVPFGHRDLKPTQTSNQNPDSQDWLEAVALKNREKEDVRIFLNSFLADPLADRKNVVIWKVWDEPTMSVNDRAYELSQVAGFKSLLGNQDVKFVFVSPAGVINTELSDVISEDALNREHAHMVSGEASSRVVELAKSKGGILMTAKSVSASGQKQMMAHLAVYAAAVAIAQDQDAERIADFLSQHTAHKLSATQIKSLKQVPDLADVDFYLEQGLVVQPLKILSLEQWLRAIRPILRSVQTSA